MISIDKIAHMSSLKAINPNEKLAFSIFSLLVCLIFNNPLISLIVLGTMSYFTIIKGKISTKIFLKMMMAPMIFLIIGVLTIAIQIVKDDSYILSFTLFSIKFGITQYSLNFAVNLFLKSLASVSCLYFLILTSPVYDVIFALENLKLPKLFIELMTLIYRYIFVLLDTMNLIYISQNSRLGYSNIKNSFNSSGKLISSLFLSSYITAQESFVSIESRCYDGEINFIKNNYVSSRKNYYFIFLFEFLLIALGLCLKLFGGKLL